jgi:hypothetical protein
MYLLVENAASTLEGLGTTCNDVSDGGEDKTVFYSKVKHRALKSMAPGDDAILERGWERHTYSSGKKKSRPLRLSPERNIGFCTRKEAFEFEEFCKIYSNNEYKAWSDYKEMKKHLQEHLRVRNPNQYDRWEEYDRFARFYVATAITTATSPIPIAASTPAALNNTAVATDVAIVIPIPNISSSFIPIPNVSSSFPDGVPSSMFGDRTDFIPTPPISSNFQLNEDSIVP